MCLILLSYDVHPVYKLVIAANRDEFYERPTAPLAIWPNNKQIVAGRDVKGGGTWMGVSPDGRLAAITNYRAPDALKPDAPTRGNLVADFLSGSLTAQKYLQKLSVGAGIYNGFNLIVYDGRELCFFSNRDRRIRPISKGFHGLSNHLLDTPWPKVRRGLELFKKAATVNTIAPETVFGFLGDREHPPDGELPETGVGLEWERILAPLFIESDIYGTRSSSLVTLDRSGNLEFHECSHPDKKVRTVAFRITSHAS